ncbi:MAG: LPS export ABC transporter periplasmic protein LptC [Veillonellales bacterium]
MKKTSYLAIVCVVLFLAGGIYYFIKEEPLNSPSAGQEAKGDPASTATFVNSLLIEEENGKRIWELTADSIEMEPNTKQATLMNLAGIFYQDNGGTIHITAPWATMDTKTKNIVLTGSVRAVASDGTELNAREARWDGQTRCFYADGDVTVTRDDTIISGNQLESDVDLEKIKVQGNARVRKGGASN